MPSRAPLRLRLLGRLSISAPDCDQTAIRLSTRKAGALLAILAMSAEQTASREELATLLWGDCSEQQARQSLRQALALLRKELGDADAFTADTALVRLNPERWSIDACEFERLTRSARAEDLARAGELFAGEFLQGLNIDEEAFGEWLNSQRLRMQIIAARLCETFVQRPNLVIDGQQAAAVADRLIALDPLREDWHRIALTLYARYRGRSEALAQAVILADTLQRELGVAPDRETRDLIERIRSGELAPLIQDEPPLRPLPALAAAASTPATPAPAWRSVRTIAAGMALVLAIGVALFALGSGSFVSGHAGKDGEKRAPDVTGPVDVWQSPAPSGARSTVRVAAIAVLPFSALSETNKDSIQRVADALTDDLTNTLSRSPGLRVISGRTMMTYRGQAADVAAVGAELNVRYVLEGSVKIEDEKLRVNVALIDPRTRSPAWSARIERRNGEQSAVRDEIVGQLARELTLEMPAMEAARAPVSPGVRELNYKGWAAIYASAKEAAALKGAREPFEQALALEPQSRPALIGLGTFHALAALMATDNDVAGHLDKAEKILRPVIDGSPNGTGASYSMGIVHQVRGDFATAIDDFQHAIDYNPSHAPAYGNLGLSLIATGKPQKGLEHIAYAMRLSPRDIHLAHWLRYAAGAEIELGQLPEALAHIHKSLALHPNQHLSLRTLAVVLALSGRTEEAQRAFGDLQAHPSFSMERMMKRTKALAAGEPEFLRGLNLLLASNDPWQSPRAATAGAPAEARRLVPILVLPFETAGEPADPRWPIADMITDDLTNTLSRVATFRVISRQTARALRDRPVDVAALGAELKVKYVLEGSVRRISEALRVNVELIDPATRLPVWTDQFERDGADRQGVQDEIVGRLARQLQFEILPIESARLSHDSDADALAYRGWAALEAIDRAGYGRALALFEQALERDPQNLSALTGLGAYHARMGAQVFDTDSMGHRKKAQEVLRDVVRRDPQSSDAHFYLALSLNLLPTLPEALQHLARAIEIQPSNASAHGQIGNGLIRSGRVAEGLQHVLYAMRLSPRDPIMPVWLEFAGNAELEQKNYAAALAYFRRSSTLNPGYPRSWAGLVAASALAGHESEARDYAEKLKSFSPNLSADALVRQYGRHDTSRLNEGLRLALVLPPGAGQ